MGKHSVCRGRRSKAAAAAIAAVMAGTPALAHADEVDDLIAELDAVSQQASAKVEEIKTLEDEIAAAEARIGDLSRQADTARGDAERAKGARSGYQENVDGIAQTRYRNSYSDLLLHTLDSGSPQAAIDRAAYLGSLSRKAERTISDLDAASKHAEDRTTEVTRAVTEAQQQRADLDAKRGKLERERENLDARVRSIEARVDNLSDVERERWVNKDHPVDFASVNLAGAPTGVTSAALAQLGKPYGWGSTGPDAFDCSGLMVYAYAQNGIAIPRTSQAQLAGGTPVPLSQLQPGDIIGYYPGTTHVGMYIGDGMIVHSSDYGIPIQVVPYDSMPITGAVRY